jgi:hypothetical protein
MTQGSIVTSTCISVRCLSRAQAPVIYAETFGRLLRTYLPEDVV